GGTAQDARLQFQVAESAQHFRPKRGDLAESPADFQPPLDGRRDCARHGSRAAKPRSADFPLPEASLARREAQRGTRVCSVSPRCTASPRTMSRIRSNGLRDESSQRPITRVTRTRNAKRTMARSAMSTGQELRKDRDRVPDLCDLGGAVVQPYGGCPMADVGRVDLKLHEQQMR